MSKKNKNVNQESVVENAEVANKPEVENVEPAKNEKASKKDVKVDNKKVKKEKKQSKLGRKAKETFSELKKVTWPTFPQVVKKTGVVLAVVLFFGIVLLGFDYVLKFMFKLLTKMPYTTVELWVTVGIVAAIVVLAIVGVVLWRCRKKRKESK